MAAAEALLALATVFLAVGCAVAIVFVVAGIGRVMHEPGPVTLGARILILPGSALLWPVILRRWIGRR